MFTVLRLEGICSLLYELMSKAIKRIPITRRIEIKVGEISFFIIRAAVKSDTNLQPIRLGNVATGHNFYFIFLKF